MVQLSVVDVVWWRVIARLITEMPLMHQKYTLHNWKAKVLCCLYGITELASPLPPSRSLASIIAALSSYHITVINK